LSSNTAGSFIRIDGGPAYDYFITDEGVFRVRTTSYQSQLLVIVLLVLLVLGDYLLFGTYSPVGGIGVLLILVSYLWLAKRKTRKLSLEGLRTLYSGGGVTRFGWNEIQNMRIERNRLKFEYAGKKYSIRLRTTQLQPLERVLNSLKRPVGQQTTPSH